MDEFAANNQDGSVNSSANSRGQRILRRCISMGTGLLERSVGDGEVAASLARSTVPVTRVRQQDAVRFYLASTPAEVYYAGSSPGIVFGGTVIIVRIPTNLLAEFWKLKIGNAPITTFLQAVAGDCA